MGKINRQTALLAVCAALTLIWMGVIFAFSAADSLHSANLSGGLFKKLLAAVVPHWSSLPAMKQKIIYQRWHTMFRKCGHFSEYAVLGALLTLTIHKFFVVKNRLTLPKAEIWLPVLLSFLYAVSDEIHQIFVAGRSCEFRDMMLDTAGACCGMGIYYLLHGIWKKHHDHTKKTVSV